jgi:hypothetical protein
MKMVKSLILGSAAGLVVLGGAQAADLPVKAKAVEYVKICSLYGAGFYYIPGTDTCINIGGYLRADVIVNAQGDFTPGVSGAAGQQVRTRNSIITRSRQDLHIDTRTATEYGVLRTFADVTLNWTTGDNVAGGTLGVYYAFIQFAGFTMGKAISAFDTPWVNYPANINDFLSGHGDVTGVNQLSYTAEFGGGISATVSAQDQTAYYQTNLYNTSTATTAGLGAGVYGTNSLGGQVAPDLVGVFKVDQAWGIFQVSVAAHDNHASYYVPANETSGHPSDVWGYAGQLGLEIKNIPTGKGDVINMSAGYSNGASRYIFQSLMPTAYAMYGSSGVAFQSLALAGVADGVFANGTGISTPSAWAFRGGYTHNWSPYWASSIAGSIASINYGATASNQICTAMAAVLTVGSTCNPNFSISSISANTIWTPVKNLAFTAEVVYTSLNQKYAGTAALPAIGAAPATTYELKSQNTWTLGLRAQRVF